MEIDKSSQIPAGPDLGSSYTPESRAWVVGLAKNCELTLEENIRVLEEFCTGFPTSWIIVESNSTDSTNKILQRYVSIKEDFTLLCPPTAPDESREPRVRKMARLRNLYLESISSRVVGQHDILLVVDLDNLLRLDSKLSDFESEINLKNAFFAASNGPYYDVFALRDSEHDFDYFVEVRARISSGLNPFRAYKEALVRSQLRLANLKTAHPVQSAFGGLALYPASLAMKCKYSDHEGCEHVHFNFEVGKHLTGMFIDPRLAIPRVLEHTKLISPFWQAVIALGSLIPSKIAKKIFDVLFGI